MLITCNIILKHWGQKQVSQLRLITCHWPVIFWTDKTFITGPLRLSVYSYIKVEKNGGGGGGADPP